MRFSDDPMQSMNYYSSMPSSITKATDMPIPYGTYELMFQFDVPNYFLKDTDSLIIMIGGKVITGIQSGEMSMYNTYGPGTTAHNNSTYFVRCYIDPVRLVNNGKVYFCCTLNAQ
jgi:hypothetical protein